MRKARICAPNIWVTSNENLGFAHPVFWPHVINCAPNLQQILPPLFYKSKTEKIAFLSSQIQDITGAGEFVEDWVRNL